MFLNIFIFYWEIALIQLNLLNFYIKQLLSVGFDMAAIGTSLMKTLKSHSSKHCHAHYKTLFFKIYHQGF